MQERQPEWFSQSGDQPAFLDTSSGKITIRKRCSVELVDSLEFDEGIGIFFHYREGANHQQQALLRKIALMREGDAVLAYTDRRVVVGYLAMHPVSEELRWGQADANGIYEFGAIEVSRNWRGLGLASKLMDVAFSGGALDDKIVISYELSWHWDLAGTGMTKQEYRGVLMNMLARLGFKEYPTDEGNIRMDPANLFTARIGPKASLELRNRFVRSLFSEQGSSTWWWPAGW